MDMDEELRKQMDRLHEDMSHLSERVGELTVEIAKMENIRENMTTLQKVVFGNSSPGLKGEIDRLKQDREKRNRDSKWMWWMLGGVTIGVIVVLFERFIL